MKKIKLKFTALAMAAAAALASFTGCDRHGSGDDAVATLRIYTWPAYIDHGIIESFERSHDCQVIVDTFNSNESMFEHMKSGEAHYDIIMPSSYYVPMLIKNGMLQKLDMSRLANVESNFDHSFDSQILDQTFTYSVPYVVTYTGLCYAKNRIPKGMDVATWAVLGNDRFKGRITMLDDIREVIGAGLMSLGYSINSVNPDEIDKAVNVILSWCRNLRKFDAETYKMEVASGTTWIGHGYSTDALQVIYGDEEVELHPHPHVGFVLPKEGFSIAFDEMVLCRDARSPDLAYAFMNYLYEGLVAKENMMHILGLMPVKPAIALLDEHFREHVIPPADVLSKGQVIKAIDDIPGAMEMYERAWDKIKSAEARMSRMSN